METLVVIGIIIFLLYVLISYVALNILKQSRMDQTSKAIWVFTILSIPFMGAIAYIFIMGEN